MKKPIAIAGLTASALILMTGCAGATSAEEGATKKLDFAYYGSPVSAYTKRYVEFADDVLDTTNGTVELLIRPEGELPYKPSEYVQRVGDGSIDMAGALSSFMSGECPVAGVFGLPMLATDHAEWSAMHDAASAALEPCLTKYGVTELWSYGYPSMQIFGSGTPPKSIEDLQGLQIRQTGPEWSEWIKGIGATPVTIETAEVGGALQQGVIDAVISSADTVKSRWGEEIDWVFMLDVGVLTEYAIANATTIEALPADAKEGLNEVSQRYEAETSEHFASVDDAALQALEDEFGVTIVTPADTDRAKALTIAQNGWESWASSLAGSEGTDALATLRAALGQ
ncbi:TRAP transporter substrate-binding protein [Leucobacter chinensis]|uniref:TRAP transporter substrate-binding protein n=1 Tax=Leucobacter chinensis TaxID=2851010 RepID=UPI001C24EEF6|nr:TRAP transporter substrate-binding protein DctP [Leucobacter chinensis]